MTMKQYIVTADYTDFRGLFASNQYWLIDDEHNLYKAEDLEGKIKELIPLIRLLAGYDENISKVKINVYEVNKVDSDKFNVL